jgi:TRAP-type C4-dicarboxylate transport system permease small subunit
MEKYKKFCNKLAHVLSIVCGSLLMVVFFVAIVNILFRNIFKISWLFSQVLSKMAFIWMVFIGASVVYYRGEHLKMDFFCGKFPKKMRTIVDWGAVVCTISLLVVMFIYGINVSRIRMSIPFESFKAMPTGYLYISIPTCAVLMFLFTIQHIINLVKTGRIDLPNNPSEEEVKRQEEEVQEGISALKDMSQNLRK